MNSRSLQISVAAFALSLSAIYCTPPVAEPDAGPPVEDAGVLYDAGGPYDAGVDAGCVPPPDALPSDAEVVAEFDAQGLAVKLNACASCHNTGTPTGNNQEWGPAGDLSPAAWCGATATSITTDAESDVLLTQAYDAFAENHPVDNEADPVAAAALVAWWSFATTPAPQPNTCDDPPVLDAGPSPTPDAGVVDAGVVDAGGPNGEAGVPYQVRFGSLAQTVPRITCTSTLTRIELIDGVGAVMDNPGPNTIYVSILTPAAQPGSFWSDTNCFDGLIDRVGIDVGESSATFRWMADDAGDFEIEARPVGENALLGDKQMQTIIQ
ncbi:MAG: hypothetical protein GY822_02885 [Deltaproteobacteria bacterium]|nr:hypothetical protein [Deltaproteobacteria bacterium]